MRGGQNEARHRPLSLAWACLGNTAVVSGGHGTCLGAPGNRSSIRAPKVTSGHFPCDSLPSVLSGAAP